MSKEIVHDFGSMKAIFKPSADDTNEGIIEITGMKTKDELPEEYINGYPMCYKYSDCFYMLKDSHGNYCYGDGSIGDDSYSIHIINPRYITQNAFGIVVEKLLACSMRLYEINHRKKETDMFNELNALENIFTNMPAYQSEVVYKYGQITVKIKRCHIDEYSINIDSGNLDLYNRYTIFYSNFIDLKPRIEFDNNYKKNGYWYIIENNHYFEDSWENGDIFTSKQINCILNAVKNTVEFIEQNGGAIINKTKLITKEEMLDMLNNKKILPAKVSLLQWERKLEKIKSERLTECFRDTMCALCYANDNSCTTCSLSIVGSGCNIRNSSWKSVYGYNGGDHEELVKRTEKMIEVLRKAVEYEEQQKIEVTNIGKMVLKAEKVENDVYQCSIEGMKYYDELPHEYTENVSIIHCGVFRNNNRFTIINKYYNNMHFSLYSGWYDPEYLPIENFKVTKEELDELKRLLQICSDNLHRINNTTSIEVSNTSSSSKKEKMKIKVTQTDNNKVILEITGMKDPDEFNDKVYFMCARYWKADNTIQLYGEEEDESLELDGCHRKYDWIRLGKEYPMEKETAKKIITILGASAAKLHAINHKDENYELEL